MRTKAAIKKAAVPAAAISNKQQSKPYRKGKPLSTLKMLIGEFLLFGNKQQKEFWWLFDAKLRKYVDLKISVGAL